MRKTGRLLGNLFPHIWFRCADRVTGRVRGNVTTVWAGDRGCDGMASLSDIADW